MEMEMKVKAAFVDSIDPDEYLNTTIASVDDDSAIIFRFPRCAPLLEPSGLGFQSWSPISPALSSRTAAAILFSFVISSMRVDVCVWVCLATSS
jgi:hypothetical protein